MNLCVVEEILQRVAASEAVIKVCGVADHPPIIFGGVNVPRDDN